jgi:transglutaminase-like putative cysteine protease
VKIYKKVLAEKFLNGEILTYQHNNDEEKITSLKVITYNFENDKITETKADKTSKLKSKESENYTVTKFTFENVKDGSVIEYKYTVSSPFYWLVSKVMVEDIAPIRRFEYVFDFPKFLGYNMDYKGDIIPSVRDVSDKIIYGREYHTYRFGYDNIPPYRDEKYVGNIDNYRTSIRAELNSTNIERRESSLPGNITTGGFKSYAVTWNDIRKQLYDSEYFGVELKKNHLVKDLLPQEIKSIESPQERAAAILKFVQSNYVWNGYYSAFTDKGIKDLLKNKTGNIAEINFLLIMLMRNADLKSEPVVLSTINRGLLTDYSPSVNMLNYVLAVMDFNGKPVLYDATSKMTLPNLIRSQALNYSGYIMTKTEAKKIDIFCPEKSETFLTVDAKLNKDGTFTGNFSDRDTKFWAMVNSEFFDKDNITYQNQYKEKYRFPFTNIKTELLENNDFQTIFDFDSDTFADVIGGKIIFNPLLFLYHSNHEFDQTEPRRSPLEFYTAHDKTKKVTITIPDGYVFENIPKSKKFRTEDSAISYLYKITEEGNKLTVETTVSIESPVYPKEYYPFFKQIFDNITQMENGVVTVVRR